MSFAALHTVEQQLVMQFCDRATFLSLARCSRSILAAASCEFACRFLSPVRVRLQANVASLVSHSLLRFCDVSLWIDPDPPSMQSLSEALSPDLLPAKWLLVLDACASVPRLRALSFAANIRTSDESDWNKLFEQPNLSQTHSLTLSGVHLDHGAMRAIVAHLPHLRSLRVLDRPMGDEMGPLLCKLPALTELDECDHTFTGWTFLSDISNCTGLRKLVLRDWQAEVVYHLLTTKTFKAQLEELTLWSFCLEGQVQNLDWWTKMFAGLSRLSRLTLHCYNDVSTLIKAAVTQCPTLETVIVRADLLKGWLSYWTHLGAGTVPSDESGDMTFDDMIPPPDTLRTILTSRTEMHAANPSAVSPLIVRLHVPPSADVPIMIRPSHPHLTMADWDERVRSPFTALSNESSAAVRLQLIESGWPSDDGM